MPSHESLIYALVRPIEQGNRLVYSFDEASDYVYDVQWSPTHPAVFASVDGQSRLCLWNLNEDVEVHQIFSRALGVMPAAEAVRGIPIWWGDWGDFARYGCDDPVLRAYAVEPSLCLSDSRTVLAFAHARDVQIPVVTTKVSERGSALNHVRWSADGRRLLVGDLDGRSYVYEVGEVCIEFSLLSPNVHYSFEWTLMGRCCFIVLRRDWAHFVWRCYVCKVEHLP